MSLRDLTETCVHCGFCLPSCPTYQLWGEEMDSPRGRIHLLSQLLDGAPTSSTVVGHFDACLGCLACVTACPSGVRYDEIIAEARVLVESTARRPLADRLVRAGMFALFPYPRRLRLSRGLLRFRPDPALAARIHPTLGALAALAPPLRRPVRLPPRVRAWGARRAVVGLLTGCVQNAFFSHVSAATARVLAREGCDVIVPRGQSCCGALARHAGRDALARRSARRLAATFARAGVDTVVTDVAGCGSMLKEYESVLGTPVPWRAVDVTEYLVSLGEPLAPRRPVPLTVAYHDACHLAHGQGVRSAPRQLLAGIPSLRVVSPRDPDVCCGSAGVYNLLQPEAAMELGRRKAQSLVDTGAEVVVAGNPGCLLQLDAALKELVGARAPRTMHTVELLDLAMRQG